MYLALSAVSLAACSACLYLLFPSFRGLLWLGLYTVPSHMFVSPLPHEPVLLYFAKSYSATPCALTALAGCLIAGLWDFWIFVPLMRHPRVRSKYANIGLYQKSVKLFRKSPFWALVVAAATPFPFYPVKFLSICDHYPLKRYLLALTVGRTPRYWVLAYLGHVFRFPNWSLVVLALAFLVFTVTQSRKEGKAQKLGAAMPAAVGLCASTTSPEVSARSTPSGR
jgi:membrane protein YqaA with SNARE-associated domain